MRRPHALDLAALFAFRYRRAAPLVLIAGLVIAVVACGGNDKPPLTPDNLEPGTENPDGGPAPASSGSAAPAAK